MNLMPFLLIFVGVLVMSAVLVLCIMAYLTWADTWNGVRAMIARTTKGVDTPEKGSTP